MGLALARLTLNKLKKSWKVGDWSSRLAGVQDYYAKD